MLYLRSFNLIVSTQSGFQPQRSAESILIKMTDDWLDTIDQGLYTGAIFLDLRKASFFMFFAYFVYIAHLTKFTRGSSLLMEKSKAEESPW